LLSKKTLLEEEMGDSELKYLRIIEKIRDEKPELFERIKHLPKKARSAKVFNQYLYDIASPASLVTFFRKGKLMKFFLSWDNKTMELDFSTAAKIFECPENEKKVKLPLEPYYELLYKNKSAFINATIEGIIDSHSRRGPDSETKLLKILKAIQKNTKQLTESQEEYIEKIIDCLQKGSIISKNAQRALKALRKLSTEIQNPLKVIAVLQKEISSASLKSHYAEASSIIEDKREIILSLYLAED